MKYTRFGIKHFLFGMFEGYAIDDWMFIIIVEHPVAKNYFRWASENLPEQKGWNTSERLLSYLT
jgi:hypothetical protein